MNNQKNSFKLIIFLVLNLNDVKKIAHLVFSNVFVSPKSSSTTNNRKNKENVGSLKVIAIFFHSYVTGF